MAIPGHIWRLSFDLPSFDGLQAAAHAFFRTSEFGVWALDAKKANDTLTLHYERGLWKPPPSKLNYFFNGTVGCSYEKFVIDSKWDGWKAAPMILAVAFRPVPARGATKVLLEYQLAGPDPSVLFQASASQLSNCVRQETESLAHYLRENLALTALPLVADE